MTVPRVARTAQQVKEIVEGWRDSSLTVGFVPTMGALHQGHLSLVRIASAECDRVVVSIFVNPTQFSPEEDLDSYPRTLESDIEKLGGSSLDVHCVFAPPAGEIYPPGFSTSVSVSGLTENLCGRFRKGHFDGVTTVCAVLFGIVRPDVAVFGMKDAQQLAVVRRMVRDLHMGIRVVAGEIVREPDGLAMSSRNSYLTPGQRKEATVIYRGLMAAREMVAGGVADAGAIKNSVMGLLESSRMARVQYLELVDPDTMQPLDRLEPYGLLAVAVYFGNTRLIDNVLLRTPEI